MRRESIVARISVRCSSRAPPLCAPTLAGKLKIQRRVSKSGGRIWLLTTKSGHSSRPRRIPSACTLEAFIGRRCVHFNGLLGLSCCFCTFFLFVDGLLLYCSYVTFRKSAFVQITFESLSRVVDFQLGNVFIVFISHRDSSILNHQIFDSSSVPVKLITLFIYQCLRTSKLNWFWFYLCKV